MLEVFLLLLQNQFYIDNISVPKKAPKQNQTQIPFLCSIIINKKKFLEKKTTANV